MASTFQLEQNMVWAKAEWDKARIRLDAAIRKRDWPNCRAAQLTYDQAWAAYEKAAGELEDALAPKAVS